MQKFFHNLITNTTSLVWYIAILMFVGAYYGGDKSYALDPLVLKGSIMENRTSITSYDTPQKSIIIMLDGRQYRATIGEEIIQEHRFTY